jgi:NAD+ synthase (glutamine-hydrolysing)
MRVALAQINTTVGDFAGNARRIRDAIARARGAGAELVVFPELTLCGYPPLDLLDRHAFLAAHDRTLEELARESQGMPVILGALRPAPPGSTRRLHNTAVVLVDGRIDHVQDKTLLPTYDVFDEARYFEPASKRTLWSFGGRRIGIAICEDLWCGEFWETRPYPIDPVTELVDLGAEIVVALSASPWERSKIPVRDAMLCDASQRHGVPFVFVNLVGGNDELVFDGTSLVVSDGRVVARLARFAEDLAVVDPFAPGATVPPADEADMELLERALVMGLRDYLHKLGLERAVVGLSGGIDSAVTAHLAALAVGPENVLGLLMPGPYSSDHSVRDAHALAASLGIEARTVPIGGIYDAFRVQFGGLFGPADSYGITQENLQARIRGTLLMAVSNREDRIVLATGNKSELSVGYTTLYGDLVGGLAVLGDVLKRDVYGLARWANRNGARIPQSSLEKPPSAELAPDQRDSDSLPPYDQLDEVLAQALERGLPAEAIRPPGVAPETVRWVLRQLDRAEYKRRQAPMVLRVSPKAFGSGRRIPIVQRSEWGAE